jgi:hypothetical protein
MKRATRPSEIPSSSSHQPSSPVKNPILQKYAELMELIKQESDKHRSAVSPLDLFASIEQATLAKALLEQSLGKR